MVQIISPTRIMPGGLRFVDSNIARETFNEEDRHRVAMNQDRRAGVRFDNEQEDRRLEKEREKLEADLILEQTEDTGEVSPSYTAPPAMAPSTASAPVGAPERVSGLSGVSSAAAAEEPPIPAYQPIAAPKVKDTVHMLMPGAQDFHTAQRTTKMASASPMMSPPSAEPEMIDGMPADLYRSGAPAVVSGTPDPSLFRPGMPGVVGVDGDASSMMRGGVPYAKPGGKDFTPTRTDNFTPARTDNFSPAPQRVSSGYDISGSAAPGGMEEITVTGQREPRSGLRVVKSTDPVAKFRRELAKRLAGGGYGTAARTSYEQALTGEKASEDGDWKRAMEILERAEAGDINGAMLLSQRYGENIPPDVLANGQARRIAKTSLEYAKTYGATHDQEWIAKFGETFGKTGDVQQALTAAGRPTPAPNKGYRPLGYTVTRDGRVLNRDTGALTGEATPGGSGSGSQPREIQLFNWMTSPIEKGGRGMDPAAAEKLIFQVKNNPGAKANAIVSLARAYVTQGMDPAESRKQAIEDYSEIEKAIAKPGDDGGDEDPIDPDEETVERAYGSTTGGDEPDIYSDDNGETWYYIDGDTRYDEGID